MEKEDLKEKRERLEKIAVVTEPHRIHPDCITDNYFAVATADGEKDLERKAREGFLEISLPEYICLIDKKELKVGDRVVHYALAYGVYGR